MGTQQHHPLPIIINHIYIPNNNTVEWALLTLRPIINHHLLVEVLSILETKIKVMATIKESHRITTQEELQEGFRATGLNNKQELLPLPTLPIVITELIKELQTNQQVLSVQAALKLYKIKQVSLNLQIRLLNRTIICNMKSWQLTAVVAPKTSVRYKEKLMIQKEINRCQSGEHLFKHKKLIILGWCICPGLNYLRQPIYRINNQILKVTKL